MEKWPQETVQIIIPSILGYEKIVLSAVREIARCTGFTAERVEDMGTAVQEACINAIEHGNRGVKNAAVQVTITNTAIKLQIEVQDCGRSPLSTDLGLNQPSLEERIAGTVKKRGWGLYLMRQLADSLEFGKSGNYNIVRLVFQRL